MATISGIGRLHDSPNAAGVRALRVGQNAAARAARPPRPAPPGSSPTAAACSLLNASYLSFEDGLSNRSGSFPILEIACCS
jgi:hypothetical protein